VQERKLEKQFNLGEDAKNEVAPDPLDSIKVIDKVNEKEDGEKEPTAEKEEKAADEKPEDPKIDKKEKKEEAPVDTKGNVDEKVNDKEHNDAPVEAIKEKEKEKEEHVEKAKVVVIFPIIYCSSS